MKNVVLYARGGSQEEVNRQFQNMEEALDLDPEANVVARDSDLGSGVDVNRPELKTSSRPPRKRGSCSPVCPVH